MSGGVSGGAVRGEAGVRNRGLGWRVLGGRVAKGMRRDR